MLTNTLIIGNAPDYAMRLGNMMIRHQIRLVIRIRGQKERPRTLSNFSLAGLKITIDSIIKLRAPGGVLVPGRSVFGVVYLPKNKFHMMIHPKMNVLFSEKDKSYIESLYLKTFFNAQPSKVP
jgi:hypothetical protein